MKIKVIKDCYYVHEDLTNIGLVDKDKFEMPHNNMICTFMPTNDIYITPKSSDS